MKILYLKMALLLVLGAGMLGVSSAQADEDKNMEPEAAGVEMILVMPEEVVWGDVPNALPPGAQIAVLEGDPFSEGAYTLRLMMPAGYKIPAHWHTLLERVTVLSGTLKVGMGDKLDPEQGKSYSAGGFIIFPAKMHHYAWADEDTVVQINGDGPFDINYIDPADDPRKVN